MEEQPKVRRTSAGECGFCHRTFGKGGMARHLESCSQRKAAIEAAAVRTNAKRQRLFHVVVTGHDRSDYWMHLEMPAKTKLEELDEFLRDTWLECCGHLSAFNFPVKRPARRGTPLDYGLPRGALVGGGLMPWQDESSDDRLMGESLENKLEPGVVFNHEYDFGTTTTLVLRVAGEHAAPALPGEFKLLARNDPPAISCSQCDQPATQICVECIPEGEGALCNACASRHECGEEMLAPLINSPRAGVCGYCGPSREP